VENDRSNPTNSENKIIKMSIARIEHGNYKSICKEKHKRQPIHKENCNSLKRVYIVSRVGIHIETDNIPPNSRKCIAYKMKKL
jgi:hypothetical protein